VLLSGKGLVKRYPSGCEAVKRADLDLAAGELVAVVGRSGSGKSTVLALLGALTRPTHGQVVVDGTDVWTLSEAEMAAFRARHVGFIFQCPSLLSNLSAVDNVAIPALLAGTVSAESAYSRALSLLEAVGLADHAQSFPGEMSGGEQRRVVIARALINSPRVVLADEPTSDLDEDTEADIIGLLDALRRRESFALLLVTHDLGIARRAHRTYEMRRGILEPAKLADAATEADPAPRHFGPPEVCVGPASVAGPAAARGAMRLGRNFAKAARNVLLIGAVGFAAVLLADLGLARFQEMRANEYRARLTALETMALAGLRGNVQSIASLGDGRYELTLSLWNVTGDRPIYVMAPSVEAYVQVGRVWQELPLWPVDESMAGVLKVTGKQAYRYVFEARRTDFARLLPHYMHVRFANTMLVSPQSIPRDDLFERKDNYYVYLKPWNADDRLILSDLKFPGTPPVWIPMPPH
jgi:ABC-type lipoprotein export system ATPase subunit